GGSDTAITTASSGAAVNYSGGSGLPTGNASRSAEMWFTATSGGTQLFEWGSIGTGTAFGVILASNFSVHVEDWTAGVAIDSPVPLLDGNWHYLAVTYDGTTVTVYVDGREAGSQTFGSTMATTSTTLRLGQDLGGGEH